jgi:signal transduction histidine kinase
MPRRDATGEHLQVVLHELRNPLVGIDAAARVMARDLGTHPAAQRATSIAREARHLLDLLQRVSDAEAVAAGRLRTVLRAADLRVIAREAVDAAQLGGHAVSVRVPDDPVRVRADARRLRQVLANLLSNAAQYSPTGSAIAVELARDGRARRARIVVRDPGAAIPAGQRRRLFQKFGRLTTADRTRGPCLGRCRSRAIVGAHGG